MARYYLIALSFVAIAFGWDSLFIKPGRLLAVLVHEMWHGLSAMAGGVRLDAIRIHPDEAGETLVTGHLKLLAFMISVSAGYIGTAWTGAMLLRSGLRRSYERTTLGLFTLLVFYMSYLFTEPGSTAYLTGLLASLLSLVFLFLGREASGRGLVVLGSFLVFYSLFDLYDFQQPQTTDAAILARYLESKGWRTADSWMGTISVVWTILIVGVVFSTLRSAMKGAAWAEAAPAPDGTPVTEGAPATDSGPAAAGLPAANGGSIPAGLPAANGGSIPAGLPAANGGSIPTGVPVANGGPTPASVPAANSAGQDIEGWNADDFAEIRKMVEQMKR